MTEESPLKKPRFEEKTNDAVDQNDENKLTLFSTCLSCKLSSRHIFIQTCGHIMCFACKWKDLMSARGLLLFDDSKLTDKYKDFKRAQAMWSLEFVAVLEDSNRHNLDYHIHFQESRNLKLIGCPLCKESCIQNQMNVFSLLTIHCSYPPILDLPPQPGDITECFHCLENFDTKVSTREIHKHVFKDCHRLHFPCPLHMECKIKNKTVKIWLKKYRGKKSVIGGETVRDAMNQLLQMHLKDKCRVSIDCPHCEENFEGTDKVQNHLHKQDCKTLQILEKMCSAIRDGELQYFEFGSSLLTLNKEVETYQNEHSLF